MAAITPLLSVISIPIVAYSKSASKWFELTFLLWADCGIHALILNANDYSRLPWNTALDCFCLTTERAGQGTTNCRFFNFKKPVLYRSIHITLANAIPKQSQNRPGVIVSNWNRAHSRNIIHGGHENRRNKENNWSQFIFIPNCVIYCWHKGPVGECEEHVTKYQRCKDYSPGLCQAGAIVHIINIIIILTQRPGCNDNTWVILMNSSSRVNIPLFVFRDCCIKFFSCCRRNKISSPAKTNQVYGKRTRYMEAIAIFFWIACSLFFCSIFLANNAAPKETRLFTTPLWLRICWCISWNNLVESVFGYVRGFHTNWSKFILTNSRRVFVTHKTWFILPSLIEMIGVICANDED